MPAYSAPGVYFERVDASAPALSAIRTDIVGFVGLAQRGPLNTPIPLQSWRQFQAYFGDFTGAAFLAYAVRAFFENGGRRCWVVRVASSDPLGGAAAAGITVDGASGDPVWRIAAFSPGVWGNDLSVLVRETHLAQTATIPDGAPPEYSRVASTAGFSRATLVHLVQDAVERWKVVSTVDAVESRLVWVHPQPAMRLPYDSPITGFDPDRPVVVESVEYTLVVRELGRPIATYTGLSLLPEHDLYGPRFLAPLEIPLTATPPPTVPVAPPPIVIEEQRDIYQWQAVRPTSVEPLQAALPVDMPLRGGRDGLSLLAVEDYIGEVGSPLDSDIVRAQKQVGIRVLERVSEVAVVAAPDIHIQPIATPPKAPGRPCIPDPCLPPPLLPAPPRAPAVGELPPAFSDEEIYRVQAALVDHCETRRDRIALLDPPLNAARDDRLGVSAVSAWRSRFDSTYAAFYFPWLRVVDPLRTGTALTRLIPPSGHVAGQYARSDLEVGVHKAPANVALVWAEDVSVLVDEAVHGALNPLGINAIRPLPGRGLRILGARTVSSDADWRFVNVRRLLLMIEKALDLATQWVVFEPNDVITRAKVSLAITSFLLALWQQGALAGATAEQAFFVRCDDTNNPPDARANGFFLAEVGVAPSYPFEFIVLRVGRTGNELEIQEAMWPS